MYPHNRPDTSNYLEDLAELDTEEAHNTLIQNSWDEYKLIEDRLNEEEQEAYHEWLLKHSLNENHPWNS